MKKNYQKWTKLKSKLNNANYRIKNYREGNIYWTYLGENIGSEQDGKSDVFSRPSMVLIGFYENLVYAVPIGSTTKTGEYYFPIHTARIKGSLLLSQLRAIDTIRLGDYIDKVDILTLNQIKIAISKIILDKVFP